MARQIIHIDLDAFFISVEKVLNPELAGKPAVVGGRLESRGVISCASYEARKFGLHAGMPLAMARKLCPRAIFLPGNFSAYREYSARFMDILADFSPKLEPGGLDEAFLDLTGFEPLYGPIHETALHIKERIKEELGITASIGIAPSKVVAKVASDFGKPDGLVEIAPGEEMAFLAPLPVKDLPGVGGKMQQALKRLGVTTIGQLADLPTPWMKSNFGIYGEMIRRHARGEDDREITPPGPPKSISRETTLPSDTLDERLLRSTLRYLSEKVGADLRRQNRQARCISMKLRYADFETITRSQTRRSPTDSDHEIFETGCQLLDKALSRRRHPVRLIGIGVASLMGEERQLSLMDRSTERQVFLNRAIDQIRQKYGFDSIGTGETLPLKDTRQGKS